MKLSQQVKELKESIMLQIHNSKVPMPLEELATHNKNIDDCIKELEKCKKCP